MGFGRTVDLDLVRKKMHIAGTVDLDWYEKSWGLVKLSFGFDKKNDGYWDNCRFGMLRKILGFGRTVDLDLVRKKMHNEGTVDLDWYEKSWGLVEL